MVLFGQVNLENWILFRRVIAFMVLPVYITEREVCLKGVSNAITSVGDIWTLQIAWLSCRSCQDTSENSGYQKAIGLEHRVRLTARPAGSRESEHQIIGIAMIASFVRYQRQESPPNTYPSHGLGGAFFSNCPMEKASNARHPASSRPERAD